MKKLFMSLLFASCFGAQAQIFPEEGVEGPVIVMASVEVRKGEGCTQATARTKFPLSADLCQLLLEKYGRQPILFTGEQLHYTYGPFGNGWVLIRLFELRRG